MSNRAPLLAPMEIGKLTLVDSAADPQSAAPAVAAGHRHLCALAEARRVDLCSSSTMYDEEARTPLSFCLGAMRGPEAVGAIWLYNCVLDRGPRGSTPLLIAFPAPGLPDIRTISTVLGYLLSHGLETAEGDRWGLEWRFPTRDRDHRWDRGAVEALTSMADQVVNMDGQTGAVQSIRKRAREVHRGSL